MNETTKAYKLRRKHDLFWHKVFIGNGLDIGAGSDPFKANWFPKINQVDAFDMADGDANDLSKYVKKQYDFVHSSNCLEHMNNAEHALSEWWKVVKHNGYLVFTVPDEDLYEQGMFPSNWNKDHKFTFTTYKATSWSPVSKNILSLCQSLPDVEIERIQLVNTNYDYTLKKTDQTLLNAEAFIEVVLKKRGSYEFIPKTFKHSGARGDVIYSLPTIATLGGGSLCLQQDSSAYLGRPLADKELQWLKDLLVGRCGITDVKSWNGENVEFNLDRFRSMDHLMDGNLSIAHLNAFNKQFDLSKPWLSVEKTKHIADIVINRSGRYEGPLRWQELKPYENKCVFLGYPEEYENFKQFSGLEIPLYTPTSYVDICEVLCGSKLFVGNQSFVYSLAEALKVNRIQESFQGSPNCLPKSDNGHTILNDKIIRHYLFDEKYDNIGHQNIRSLLHIRNKFYGGNTLPIASKGPVANRPRYSVISSQSYLNLESMPHSEHLISNNISKMVDISLGDYIIIVDDGFSVQGTWFLELCNMFNHQEVGAVGIKILPSKVPYFDQGAVMFSRKAIQECGFVYDWKIMCERLKNSGYSIRQVATTNIRKND